MIKKHICVWTVILFGVLLILPVLPVFSSDVSDADFYGVIQTTNNATAATRVITTITGMNTTALMAGGFLNSSANNCAIQSTTSADMPFMPGYGNNPWVMYNGAIGANTIVNSLFYTKNVTGGAIRYFPGATGMRVTDHTTIEIGDDGAISFDIIYLDTTVNSTIFEKPNAWGAYTTDEGDVNVTMVGAGYPVITSNITGSNGATSGIRVLMPADIESGDLLIAVLNAFGGGGGSPAITTPAGWVRLDYSNFTATARYGLYYKIATGAETTTNFTTDIVNSNAFQVFNIDKNTYSGVPIVGANATATSANPDPPLNAGFSSNATMYMAISASLGQNHTTAPANYIGLLSVLSGGGASGIGTAERYLMAGNQNPGTFTLSGPVAWVTNTLALKGKALIQYATSGEKDNLTVSSNTTSGDLELWIDGVNVSSITRNGISVPNTSSNYTFLSGVPYCESVSVTVNGTLQTRLAYEYDTIFHDSVGNNDGTPSFPTTGNDVDVSSELILFQPVAEPTAPPFAVGEGPDFISGNITATETPNPVSGNGSLDYPGKDFIDAMGAAGDFPEVWLPTFLAVFVLLALSVTASYFLKESGASSLFVKSVVNIVGYGVLVSLNIFDWWMLIFFFIFEQAIWFAAKERRE